MRLIYGIKICAEEAEEFKTYGIEIWNNNHSHTDGGAIFGIVIKNDNNCIPISLEYSEDYLDRLYYKEVEKYGHLDDVTDILDEYTPDLMVIP